MAGTDLAPSSDAIDGDYEVILPPPRVEWSFWRDDWPALWRIIFMPPIGGLISYAIFRAFGQ